MNWIKIRMVATGQVQEMVPHIARQLIASGMATEVKLEEKQKTTGTPVVETTALVPARNAAQTLAAFFRGPRSRPLPVAR